MINVQDLINPRALCGKQKLVFTKWRDKESDWSKSLDFGSRDKDVICRGLMRAFGFSDVKPEKELLELFHMAVSGDGNEDNKICTLHSSSLLAFLFFCNISPDNTLRIGNSVYDQVFFEIRNKVFPNACTKDKPSNVDVVLYSTTEHKLLFVESKFTEYLRHGKAFAAEKYREAFGKFITCFNNIAIDIDTNAQDFKTYKTRMGESQTANGFNLRLPGRRTTVYMHGLKQALSHIIGIATGEPQNTPDSLGEAYGTASKSFLSVAFEIDNEYTKYRKFYSDTIGQLNKGIIKNILSPYGCHNEVSIEGIRSYQQIIQDNPDYKLPKAFKGFYRII